MIYKEYEIFKKKYYETQQIYHEILTEKEELFAITQPGAISYDKERVSGGKPSNKFDDYLILKEKKQIDQRLIEIKSLLDDRQKLLKLKENELINSSNMQDRIYKYRYIDRMKVEKITRLVGYSRSQVFRILKTIKNEIERIKRG